MKKNLIVLLLMPFLIALLGVVTINTTFSFIDNDIVGIKWDYDDLEVFEKDKEYLLTAEGINEKNYPAGKGNQLVWSITNKNSADDTKYGEIVQRESNYYFIPKVLGECIITCSNEKGNVFRSMSVIIYEKGTSVITIKDKNKSSQANIDPNIYIGEYDLVDNSKVNATFYVDINVLPENPGSNLIIEGKSDNIDIDLNTGKVTIKESGNAYFTIGGTEGANKTRSFTYSFIVVDDGINVYDYNQLLYCTNQSENGEVVVLRKSFESLDFINENETSDTVLFGNYNARTKEFNFSNEVYRFTTTYNKNYIDQWNNYISTKGGTNFVSAQIISGLHVQKSFYGNGYTINMHNLTYPTEFDVKVVEGKEVYIPMPGVKDLFKGPLPFYALGDPNNTPLVKAYGQDNIGMFVDGDNIIINDINMRNCDFGNMISNLDTVGTVLETNGKNITISNSRLSNGKNIIRCFSSMNATIDNCLISNSRNFLVSVGTNEYIPVDETKEYSFTDSNGIGINSKISDYLMHDAAGDLVLNLYVTGSFESKVTMRNSLKYIQNALNNKAAVENQFKGSLTVNDTYFYRSGIASIALETMFNGPFLYNSVPSSIDTVLGMLTTNDGTNLAELDYHNLAGTSYPVELTLKGNTRFYDYKNSNNLDISGLITENISLFAASVDPTYQGVIDIDKIFPIKVYLMNQARSKGYVYNSEYINVPIAYYGGGSNMSVVHIDELACKDNIGETLSVDFIDNYLSLAPGQNFIGEIKNMMLKAVTVCTGNEPFKFVVMKGNGYLYEETPSVSDLKENAKGA